MYLHCSNSKLKSNQVYLPWDQICSIAIRPANNRWTVSDSLFSFTSPRLPIFCCFSSGCPWRRPLVENWERSWSQSTWTDPHLHPTTNHAEQYTHKRSRPTCIDVHGRSHYPQQRQLDPKQNNLDLITENCSPHLWPQYILYIQCEYRTHSSQYVCGFTRCAERVDAQWTSAGDGLWQGMG